MEKKPRGRPFMYDNKEIIRLFGHGEMSPKQIADKLGCSLKLVWHVLCKARTPEEKQAYFQERLAARHKNFGVYSERGPRGKNVGDI